MAGMCDRLIHGYFGVDYEIVWEVATEKAPELVEVIGATLESEDTAEPPLQPTTGWCHLEKNWRLPCPHDTFWGLRG